MSISVDLRTLDPLHDVTPERVRALRSVVEAGQSYTSLIGYGGMGPDEWQIALRNARVVVGALETLLAIPEKPERK